MKTITILFFTLIAIVLFIAKPFECYSSIEKKKWQGADRFGNIITENDLKKLFVKQMSDFEQLLVKKKVTPSASSIIASDVSVLAIDLEGAMLDGANFTKIIQGIDAIYQSWIINLKNATLKKANLRSLRFNYSDFTGAMLQWADLEGTYITFSTLDLAHFGSATLAGSTLFQCSLNNTNFNSTEMEGIHISSKVAQNIFFSGADLENAELRGSFKHSRLQNTNLKNARIGNADFSFSEFIDTNIEGAFFYQNVNLTSVQYEAISVPSINTLGYINIEDIWFSKGRQIGLVQLRNALKDAGLRALERKITYYIEKGETNYSFILERYLKRIFFEYTCGYGLNYFRPIIILLSLIIVCVPIYLISILGLSRASIFKKWSEDRILQDAGTLQPERLLLKGFKAITYSFYFSILSAFHFGWRDLNIGNWIARMQPNEYVLRPIGWVRSISGIQSLISIYLLALWVLSYFGRPFG